MKNTLLAIICLVFCTQLQAQETQTIKGQVIDKATRQPLIGATISIAKLETVIGTISDVDGQFSLANVPVGRQVVECQYVGYKSFVSEGIIVNSVKEVVLEIELVESGIELDEVVVRVTRNPNEPINELAVVSTRSFSVEETERIAASVNDPGRMALAYPGVQQGRDEAENTIIVRGNSSYGLLWRLEGIDIPNPNHFALPGGSSGGVTIFSAQLLSRSDFMTGGMPAEYGNSISSAFDIHFRKGNKEKREYRAKIGLLGMDFATEGPIKKGKSSYLVNYRYSTLGLLSQMGFYLVGERVDNLFQDLSFNLSFNGKSQRDHFTVFGLGGLSEEHYNPVAEASERDPLRSDHWEDRRRPSNTGVVGATYTRLIDDKSYLKAVVAGVVSEISRMEDTLDLNDARFRYNTEEYYDRRLSASLTYSRKITPSVQFKSGLSGNAINYNFFRQTSPRNAVDNAGILQELDKVSLSGKGNTFTAQAYAQITAKPVPKLSVSAGLNLLHLGLNSTTSLDPRLSAKYQITPYQSLSFAYGQHSQLLPMGLYFYTQQDTLDGQITSRQPNFDLNHIRSQHLIGAYNFYTKTGFKFSLEAYYQALQNVPVQSDPTSTYWFLNTRGFIPNEGLIGDGKGKNYGVDLAVEKFFSNQIYFLLTYSRFESKMELADGTEYNTEFASGFSSTYTLGKEFVFKNGKTLQVGARILYNGGFRYTPFDATLSQLAGRYVADSKRLLDERVDPYARIDARLAYRWNKKGYAGRLSLDIQNVLDKRNIRSVTYDPTTNGLGYRRYDGGLIPVLSYQIDF